MSTSETIALWPSLEQRLAQLVDAGQASAVEIVLKEYPQANADDQLLMDCIYAEFCLREQRGESPALKDYLERFPKLAARIRTLLELHAAIEDQLDSNYEPQNPDETEPKKRGVDSTKFGKLDQSTATKPPSKNHEEVMAELVQCQSLTPFQSQRIAVGRADSLILGAYTILDKIGEGGMGQVFKAEHRRMKRMVAIKTLPAETASDPRTIARFQREARAAGTLNHPNIVIAHDVDEANGVHFLVMEYVEGQNLEAFVRNKAPIPFAQAIDFILQVARGLEFAHSVGVVHRDIKPANLILSQQGVVKVVDLGLARLQTEGTQLTGTGTRTLMGTVDYMAPEQARDSKRADARADIYSLGCTLHYLITGKAIYSGASILEKLLAHQQHPIPSLRALRADVPESIDLVFRRMVAKKPQGRYQTMTDVIADLNHVFRPPRPLEPHFKVKTWRGLALTGVLAIVLLGLTASIVTWRSTKNSKPPTATEPSQSQASDPEPSILPTLKPFIDLLPKPEDVLDVLPLIPQKKTDSR